MIEGSIVALITPFNNNKEVNFDKLGELIDFQISNKTDAILLLGTTAETPTLSDKEKLEIIKYSINKVNKRIKIIVGITENSTAKSIEKCLSYNVFDIDAYLIITPYYNKTNNKGIIKHYEEIIKNTSKDIIIYHIPNRTGYELETNIIKQLSNYKQIVGIKEANQNFSKCIDTLSLQNNNFYVYSGNDDFILPFLSLGSKGSINVSGNIIPNVISNLIKNRSTKTFFEYYQFIKTLFIETNPIPIKEALNIKGFDVGNFRLPLSSMEENNYLKLLKECNLLGANSINKI